MPEQCWITLGLNVLKHVIDEVRSGLRLSGVTPWLLLLDLFWAFGLTHGHIDTVVSFGVEYRVDVAGARDWLSQVLSCFAQALFFLSFLLCLVAIFFVFLQPFSEVAAFPGAEGRPPQVDSPFL